MEKRTGEERLSYLKTIVDRLPEEPGSYQYWDETGTIIYVGKAKNLKKRVSSYFNKNQESAKTRILVSKIQDISYTTVRTEEDALNLENRLIKKYKPRYNVMLKDDKTYPSIAIPNTPFPKIYKTRQTDKKHVTYYGPYTFVGALNNIMVLIKHLYPLRTCNLNLTKENIEAGKFKVCLEYHLGNCKGPCVGKQTEEDYMKGVDQVREILKGNTRALEKSMETEMKQLAEEWRFEEAEAVKQKINILRNFNAKSEVVNYHMDNIDVFSIEEDTEHKSAFINFMHVKNGCINQSFTFEYKRRMDESLEELLTLGISEMRERFGSKAKEIIVPFAVEMEMNNASFTVPQRGDKKKLLELSELNVKEYKKDRLQQEEKLNPEQRAVRLLKELQDLLHLEKLPIRIECFDNSNIQGSDPVVDAWFSSKESLQKTIIASIILKRWWVQTTMLPCVKWFIASMHVPSKRKLPYPTSSLRRVVRARWAL